jgi:chitodextrinase
MRFRHRSLCFKLVPLATAALATACGEGFLGTVNEPPVASAGPDRPALVGAVIAFDASGSSDPDGTLESFAWDFGDGGAAVGATATHAFAAAGRYTVRLTVKDNRDAEATASLVVTVSLPRVAPLALVTGPGAAEAGAPLAFDGRGSTDADGTIVDWRWVFSDGAEASGDQVTHAFADPGLQSVTLTVTDDDGLAGSMEFGVRVRAVEPPEPVLPASSSWSWGLVDPADRNDAACGPFQAAGLRIDVNGTSISVTEGSNVVYTGSLSGRSFSVSHPLSGGLGSETIAATFAADYRTFAGTYRVTASLAGCDRTRDVQGTRL